MSDFRTQLSFQIKLPVDQSAWLQELLFMCTGDFVMTDTAQYVGTTEAANELFAEFENPAGLDLGDLEVHRHANMIEIWAEHSTNVNSLSEILHAFLRHFDSDQVIGFEWAESVSGMEAGCFHGGVCVVTKNEIRFKRTDDLLSMMMLTAADGNCSK